MDRYPEKDEHIYLTTFPMVNRRWFFPRYFLVEDENGRTIGKAATLWLLLDINTRHMAPPDAAARCISRQFGSHASAGPTGERTGAARRTGDRPLTLAGVFGYRRQPACEQRRATPIGACDALGFSTMREYCLKTMCIQYAAEIRPVRRSACMPRRAKGAIAWPGITRAKCTLKFGGELMPRQR